MSLFGGSINYQHIEGESNSIHSILDALSELIKIGKIRNIGLSNETPWGTMEFIHQSKDKNLPRCNLFKMLIIYLIGYLSLEDQK